MQTYLWICLILFLAGFVQGLSGFGAVLFSLPLLSIFLDIKTVIPLVALAALMMTLIVLIQLWRHLEWKKVYPLIIGALPGVFVGVYFLKKFDKGVIHWILGATLIVYALYSLFIQKSVKGIRERWAFLFGFLGGCLGGAFSAGGPPAIVYTSLSSWNKDQIKVTLQLFCIIRFICHHRACRQRADNHYRSQIFYCFGAHACFRYLYGVFFLRYDPGNKLSQNHLDPSGFFGTADDIPGIMAGRP